MKNLVFSLLLCSAMAFGQIPVTDAAANANLVLVQANISTGNMTLSELLAIQSAAKGEAVQTTTNTMNTLKETQKMREMFEKINSAVSSSKLVDNIWDKSKAIIQLTFDIQRALHKTDKIGGENKKSFINMSTDMMNETQPILEIANQVLSSGILNANDMERINVLMDIDNQLDEILENLQAFNFHSLTLNGVSLDELNKG